MAPTLLTPAGLRFTAPLARIALLAPLFFAVACHRHRPARNSLPAEPAPAAVTGGGVAATPGAKREIDEVRVFQLHKFMQRIGVERDTFMRSAAGNLEAKAPFGFQDRGVQVPLTASFELAPDGTFLRYAAWGNTSRFSNIDERISLGSDGLYTRERLGEAFAQLRMTGPHAVVSGYAPLLGQDLLLRAWAKQGRPLTMTTVQGGKLSIVSRGKANYELDGKPTELEQVSVTGLVWGREDAWLDKDGKLVAVITRDDEFDQFEAVLEPYSALMPTFASRAGTDSVAWLAEAAKGAERGPTGVVALVGATLIDGTGREPVADAVVVYAEGKIVSAGPRNKVQIPANAVTISLAGKSLLPGLWDMHAHLEQAEQGVAYLAAGVTTVRDMGNVMEFITGVRDAINNGKGLGPRVLVNGLVDGEGSRSIGTLRVKRQQDIAPLLDKLKAWGCLEVKLYSSFPPDLVKPLAAEAHRRGFRVTGHIPADMNIIDAIRAGYDGVSHITHLFGPLFAPGEPAKISRHTYAERIIQADLAKGPLKAVIDEFVAKKTVLDDTIALYEMFSHTNAELAQREPGIAKVPQELKTMVTIGARPEDAAERGAMFAKYMQLLGELHRRGVPIVAGTDISVPGHSLHRELELFVQAGFTPMAAIQAATSVPARVLGLAQEAGTVEPGKRADLLILADNPLTDIRNIRKIEAVIAQGKKYDPATLWQLVGFTP